MCHGCVTDVSRLCHGYVTAMPRLCNGCVTAMYRHLVGRRRVAAQDVALGGPVEDDAVQQRLLRPRGVRTRCASGLEYASLITLDYPRLPSITLDYSRLPSIRGAVSITQAPLTVARAPQRAPNYPNYPNYPITPTCAPACAHIARPPAAPSLWARPAARPPADARRRRSRPHGAAPRGRPHNYRSRSPTRASRRPSRAVCQREDRRVAAV